MIRKLFLCFLVSMVLAASHAHAQSSIRDSEIEADLRSIANPIFRAAGLNPSQVRIIVLNDDTVNAFVAGGQNLFLYTGMLLETKNVDQLAGVIAHESGHMAGGHLIRMRESMEHASVESMIAAIAGVAVGVGAGDGGAGMATAMGGSEYARRNVLRNSRTLESSADAAGMSTLERMGYSCQGMADFLEHLSSQEVLPEMQRSAYVLTHPLSRDRLSAVEAFLGRSRYKTAAFPADWETKFRRMQAKILAFTQPAQAERTYAGQTGSDAIYALAIAAYRQGRIPEAMQKIDTLLKTDANNPYLYELRGQIQFEQGNIPDAVTAYRRAVELSPKTGLLHLYLAQALLQKEIGPTKEAIDHLLKARELGERDTSLVYRWLAVAYGRDGQEGLAKLALAEEALLKRDLDFAVMQAKRAQEILPQKDVASRQRAADVIANAQRIMRNRKK